MTPQEICARAADYLDDRECCGAADAQDAVYGCSPDSAAYVRALDHLYESLSMAEGDTVRDLLRWSQGRTRAQAIAALREAARTPAQWGYWNHGG
jgi:hypothetical protein